MDRHAKSRGETYGNLGEKGTCANKKKGEFAGMQRTTDFSGTEKEGRNRLK